jgi:predicted alpha/beta-hydrolase family hydrolase
MFAITLADGRETAVIHYAASSPRGIDVVTFDFPYMHAKRGAPDKAPVLEACFRAVIEASRALDGVGTHRLFIGGKSMGDRMATHLGAQQLPGLCGIVALGYPLHPPGQPQKLRVEHLPAITVPVLIVQGEKDAFGSPAELAPHVQMMPAGVTLEAIAGDDHSLSVLSKKGAEVFEGILDTVVEWMRGAAARRVPNPGL